MGSGFDGVFFWVFNDLVSLPSSFKRFSGRPRDTEEGALKCQRPYSIAVAHRLEPSTRKATHGRGGGFAVIKHHCSLNSAGMANPSEPPAADLQGIAFVEQRRKELRKFGLVVYEKNPFPVHPAGSR